MAAADPYVSRFKNRYGEQWEFIYDPASGKGVLRGSDVDWQSYPVIGGHVEGLILIDEEIHWMREAWSEATRGA